MTLSEKLHEIELHYNYWVGNFNRKDLSTNNVRIVAEGICKAIILNKKGEDIGTQIILGKHSIPTKRIQPSGKLNFIDLIQTLRELNVIKGSYKHIDYKLELIRDRTNSGSHSSNTHFDNTTLDDLEVCNTNIFSILTWFYSDFLQISMPISIVNGNIGEQTIELLKYSDEKWNNFLIQCENFDSKRFQYIFISPPEISKDTYTVHQIAKLPWRLVVDFNHQTDEKENGLLFNFNRIKGQGYKTAFTINDRIEFQQDFHHYWFLANGQGTIQQPKDFKAWRLQYKNFLSNQLYQAFNKGSRIKSRIVVMLNIDRLYAETIIDEFNRIDEPNLNFLLCSEIENYESVFEKNENVKLVAISPIDIANGIANLNTGSDSAAKLQYLIPYYKDEKNAITPVEVSQDHFDYLSSLGIEVIYKGIEETIQSDEDNGFFKGGMISWRDLAEQKDVARNTLEQIQKKLDAKLLDNRLQEFSLIHEAGAGGTTLARRIAFNYSSQYPTIILRKYIHKKTIEGLRIIYDQYTKGRLPLLIVIESFEVSDSHLLYKDLSNSKKNAVLLIINRGYIFKQLGNNKFTLKGQLEGREIMAFENTYSKASPEAKNRIKNLIFEFKNTPQYISPVSYALTAFGKDYNGLEKYISRCINGITIEQKKLCTFICLIYYYTQISVPIELFASLFNIDRSKCDLISILGNENPLLELLHQESDDFDYYNIWRPRYAILGEEAMKTLIGGVDNKENWRANLTGVIIELIECIKASMPYLDDTTNQIFNSLFIERSMFDETIQDNEFTKVFQDILLPNDGVTIFEALTNAYPDEAHFHGHFARYLYSSKIGIQDYGRAIEEAETSLIDNNENSSLLHTLGMCYREKAESLIYSYEAQGMEIEEAESLMQDITQTACNVFDECIEKDPDNIYGYESQIRTVLKALDFGFRIHHSSSKELFITDPNNGWYAEKLDRVSTLLEEALYVVEQSMALENRERLKKSAGYIADCEGIFYKTLGRNLTAKSKFEDLIKNPSPKYGHLRPHYRRMFVMCLLASKSTHHQKDLFQAWSKVSEGELEQCVRYLNDNIFDDPTNTQNIRLWLSAVRHQKSPVNLITCISKITTWTQVVKQSTNSLLEGYYYLYVLNSIKAIRDGNTFDEATVQYVKKLQEEMKPHIKNEKFCYEWFGYGNEIKQMVNHKVLGEFTSDFFEKNANILSEVTGRIKSIQSSQAGIIILDCGLEAFFVPNVGGFTQRDYNEKVKFYVGFRYDQIQAWSVLYLNTPRNNDKTVRIQEMQELNDFIAEVEDENINENKPLQPDNEQPKTDRVQLPGPKIIGKINLPEGERGTKFSKKKK